MKYKRNNSSKTYNDNQHNQLASLHRDKNILYYAPNIRTHTVQAQRIANKVMFLLRRRELIKQNKYLKQTKRSIDVIKISLVPLLWAWKTSKCTVYYGYVAHNKLHVKNCSINLYTQVTRVSMRVILYPCALRIKSLLSLWFLHPLETFRSASDNVKDIRRRKKILQDIQPSIANSAYKL